jgi:hypothetical protein
MVKYVVHVSVDKRGDNPYINDKGYLSMGDTLIKYDLATAKRKAKQYGGTHHKMLVSDKPNGTFYSDYVVNGSEVLVKHEMVDGRVKTECVGKIGKQTDIRNQVFDVIDTEKNMVIII